MSSRCVYTWCETAHDGDAYQELTDHHFQTIEVVPGLRLYAEISDGKRSIVFDPHDVDSQSGLISVPILELTHRLAVITARLDEVMSARGPRRLRRDPAATMSLAERDV